MSAANFAASRDSFEPSTPTRIRFMWLSPAGRRTAACADCGGHEACRGKGPRRAATPNDLQLHFLRGTHEVRAGWLCLPDGRHAAWHLHPLLQRMASDLLLQSRRNPLEVFFAPRSVALIGASEQPGSVGRSVLRNLVTNPFGGTVYAVNPAHSSVLGIKAYPSIAAAPDTIDLAGVATPAQTVPGVIRECAQAGVQGAIILSAGFRETGAEGLRLEEEVREGARAGRVRILGPHCRGMMCPHSGLNATFAGAMARPGNVAFLSQSGALLTAVLDWSLQENVGFSAFA